MEIDTLLSLFAFIASLIGLAAGIEMVITKVRAERDFLKLLASDDSARDLCRLRQDIIRNGVARPDDLQQLVRLLEQVATRLPGRYRRSLLQGLQQRFALSRARYVAKLLNKAGIGEGAIPIAIE